MKAQAMSDFKDLSAFEMAAKALELTEKAEDIHANCDECGGEGEAEECEFCFPSADDSRIARRTALAALRG
jgi:hypothetical protein